jgi:hypothetical protein
LNLLSTAFPNDTWYSMFIDVRYGMAFFHGGLGV